MNKLTKPQIDSLDSKDMWARLLGFPAQWDRAVEMSRELTLDIDSGRVRNICIAGLGGSAIGGELIRAYSYRSCQWPVQLVRHYDIPRWVGEQTLFIICSFSGNTEEALAAAEQARMQGAQLVALTSGGELMVRATREDFDYLKLPGGMPSRAALGYMFVPLFRIFQRLGLIDESKDVLAETSDLLHQQAQLFRNTDDNEALTLARSLMDTLPVIYSDGTTMAPVNLRWRNQIEENAKTLAYGHTLPEMNHNEIVGWERIVHLTGRLSVIMLRDREDHPKVQQRMQIVEELIADQTASINVLRTRGESRLTRMFSLVQLGDWTSFYFAMLNGVDPTPVTKIDLLKRRLSEL